MARLKMMMRAMTRKHPCSVSKCKNRDVYVVHRGGAVGQDPLYLCDACIGDLAASYAAAVGAEKAKETFAALLSVLAPAPVSLGDPHAIAAAVCEDGQAKAGSDAAASAAIAAVSTKTTVKAAKKAKS